VYLPGDRLVGGRSWCRAGADDVVLDGDLRLRADEEFKRFSLTFDGAGEATTSGAPARRLGGAGIAVRIRVTLNATVGPRKDFDPVVGVAPAADFRQGPHDFAGRW
jgi:hypothetical protein